MEVSSSPFCEVVEVLFPVGGIFCLPSGGLSSSSVFVSPAVDVCSGRFAWVIPWRADADLVLRCCYLWMVVVLASPSYGVRRGSCGIFQRLAPLVRAVVEVFPVLDVFSGGGDWTLEFTVATVGHGILPQPNATPPVNPTHLEARLSIQLMGSHRGFTWPINGQAHLAPSSSSPPLHCAASIAVPLQKSTTKERRHERSRLRVGR